MSQLPRFSPTGEVAAAHVQVSGLAEVLWSAQTDDELVGAGRHLAHLIDPDRAERRLEAQLERDERAAHHARCLSIVDDGAGGVPVKGRGSVEDGAVLRAALLPLTSPVPAVDPSTGQELHDPRDHGARLWDALVATAQHSLDTDAAPQSHGSRPRITITLDQQTLTEDRPGHGVTHDGLDLPAGVVRRLACDADLIPAVLGTDSKVLDVGRRHRLITTALWTALVLRDRHSTFPACTRPPVMCHAHHIVYWIQGGTTALDNLALLCGHHHRVIHESPWEVRLNPNDRKPEFRGPPALRRSPTWLRNRPRLQ